MQTIKQNCLIIGAGEFNPPGLLFSRSQIIFKKADQYYKQLRRLELMQLASAVEAGNLIAVDSPGYKQLRRLELMQLASTVEAKNLVLKTAVAASAVATTFVAAAEVGCA